jgi:hypothetical protein
MFFGPKSRRSTRFGRWLTSPLMPVLILRGVHFDTPDDDGLDGDGTPAGGTGAAPAAPAAAPAATNGNGHSDDPRLRQAIGERKKARAAFRALLRGMGLDPEQIRAVNTGDAANPIRFEGAPDLDQRLQLARAAGAAGAPAAARNRAGGVAGVDLATAQSQAAAYKAQVDALTRYIKRTAVIEPIRAACVQHHAIDDGSGTFDDIVELLAPRSRVDIEFDEEDLTADPQVRVYFIDGANAPRVNSTGAVMSPAEVVADFLTKKSHYRQAAFRAGPGAGGAQVGNPRRAAQVATTPRSNGNGETPEDRTAKAIESLTGGAVRADDILRSRV